MKQGLFIVLDGPEGIGKSTQVEALGKRLRSEGYDVIWTREPGGTMLGERIRELLLHFTGPMDVKTETILFQAARVQHIQELIKPAVAEGQIVLCDRYIDSTVAYQLFGKGLQAINIRELHKVTTDDYLPHITFMFDGKPHRELTGDDNYERQSAAFHNRVRMGYVVSASRAGTATRYVRIDANRDQEEITEQLFQVVKEKYLLINS